MRVHNVTRKIVRAHQRHTGVEEYTNKHVIMCNQVYHISEWLIKIVKFTDSQNLVENKHIFVLILVSCQTQTKLPMFDLWDVTVIVPINFPL